MNGTAGFVAAPRGAWAPQMFADARRRAAVARHPRRRRASGPVHPPAGRILAPGALPVRPAADVSTRSPRSPARSRTPHSGKAIKPVLLMEGSTHDALTCAPSSKASAASSRPRCSAARRKLFAAMNAGHRPGDRGDARPRLRPATQRNRLDLFRATAQPSAPVLVYRPRRRVRDGRQAPTEAPVLRRTSATFAARQGWVGVHDDLSPGARRTQFPAGRRGPRGGGRAGSRANVAQYGGDPDRIVLSGQSAGAAHVAGYVAHKALPRGRAGGGIAGAVADERDLRHAQQPRPTTSTAPTTARSARGLGPGLDAWRGCSIRRSR